MTSFTMGNLAQMLSLLRHKFAYNFDARGSAVTQAFAVCLSTPCIAVGKTLCVLLSIMENVVSLRTVLVIIHTIRT